MALALQPGFELHWHAPSHGPRHDLVLVTPLRPRREAWDTETSIDPRAFTTKAFHIHVTSHNVFRFFGVSFTSTRLRDVLYEYSGVVQIRYVFERIYFLRKYRRIQRIYKVGPTYFPTRGATSLTSNRLDEAVGSQTGGALPN